MALGLAACGRESHPESADANNNGGYVDAGPITYQLQVSRQLNPYATEDSQYLAGLPAGTAQPKPDELWYAVFLRAKNQSDNAAKTADSSTSSTPRATSTTRWRSTHRRIRTHGSR